MNNDTKNDPVHESERRGITPDFLGVTEDISTPRSLIKQSTMNHSRYATNNPAAARLQQAESAASGGLYRSEDSLTATRKRESEPRSAGLYAGSGSKAGGKDRGKGKFKKSRPFIAIILSIFGFGGIMMGAQIFQPFSLVAQFQEKFNSMSISTSLRSSRFVKWQMSDITDGNVKDPISLNVFGKAKFKISSSQRRKLSAQGIEVIDDYEVDGKKVTAMVYTKGEVSADGRHTSTTTKVITADNFDDMYANDAEFHQAYNTGSKTWRGQFANWFGSTVINFLTNNKLTRNLFADFRQRVDDSPGKSSMDVFKEVMSEKIAGTKSKMDVASSSQNDNHDDVDDDGNANSRKNDNGDVYADEKNPVQSDSPSPITASSKVSEVAAKLKDISSKFSKGVGLACGLLQVAGTISIIVAAAEAIQIINLTTAAFETVDKVKAGYGDEAPINELTTALNSKTANITYKLEGEIGEATESGIGTLHFTYEKGQQKSAMESSGIAALYSNGEVNADDPSVGSFNLSKSLNGVIGGFTAAGTSFATCAAAKMGVAALSATSTVLCIAGIIGAIFTAGGSLTGCSGKFLEITGQVAASVIISGLVAVFVPAAAKLFTRNLVENLGGEDFGNALTSGGNMYLGNVHKVTGGSLATPEQYASYLLEQQTVIADQARYERESLSPFDATSKYTFMGVLATGLASFATSSGTLMNTIKTGGSVLSNSIIAMTPTATAYNIADVIPKNMNDYEKTCPYLASIGAVGDAFCNPYMMTDTTTMNMEPTSVIEQIQGDLEDGLTNDGNVIVADDTDLARYIVYCNNRTSSFGIADYNIANSIGDHGTVSTKSSAFNTAVNAGIGVTLFGDIVDILNNYEELTSMGYITGESCVAGNTSGSLYANSPSWSKAKYYQRFVEDQALAESMGLIEESAATAYYEKYLENNPLDDSYEGVLARYTGLPKDTVELALDVMWYADFIANYNPADRYAFGDSATENPEESMVFDNEYILAGEMKVIDKTIYADVRNRNFAEA